MLCAVEKSTIVCALVAFWIPESCVVSCCALSFQFQRSPVSSSALCFDGSMRYVATRDQKTTLVPGPDVHFFVSCCQTFGTAWPALSKQNQF